jgi:hypothetical protein
MSHSNISLDELERGRIRHAELPPALVARIKSLHSAFDEVYPSSLADWLDDFQRDLHPEREVDWWERLAQCYITYRDQQGLNARQRQAAFKILLSISLGGHPDPLSADAAILPERALADLQAFLRALNYEMQSPSVFIRTQNRRSSLRFLVSGTSSPSPNHKGNKNYLAITNEQTAFR